MTAHGRMKQSKLYRAVYACLVCGRLASSQSGPEDLRLTVGKSIVIDYPGRHRADLDQQRGYRGRLSGDHAGNPGARKVLRNCDTGGLEQIRPAEFLQHHSRAEPGAAAEAAERDFPEREDPSLQSSRDSLSLTGTVSRQRGRGARHGARCAICQDCSQQSQLTAGTVEKQILFRVKFAELDRTRARQFAVNIVSTGAANTPGRVTTGQFPAPSLEYDKRQSGRGRSGHVQPVHDQRCPEHFCLPAGSESRECFQGASKQKRAADPGRA